MTFGQDFEKIFFINSLANPKYLLVHREGFYSSKEIDLMAYLALKFYNKFHESPTKEQMKLLAANSKFTRGIVTSQVIDLIYSTNLHDYDKEWLRSTSESWIKWRNFDISLIDGIEFVKTAKVNPENAESLITKFREIINGRNNLNFDTDLGLDFFNPEHHVQKPEDKIRSGWNFIDNITGGGYDRASLVVYTGEQNIGKCSTYSQYITLRNKKTKEISKIKIGDFFKLIKSKHEDV